MQIRKIGSRVVICGGMQCFVAQRGTIIDNTERDGRKVMFRVRLDTPIDVPGVGRVTDDLWAGDYLRARATFAIDGKRVTVRA